MPHMFVCLPSTLADNASFTQKLLWLTVKRSQQLGYAAICWVGLLAGVPALAHDDGFSVGISIGNPYPPGGRYYLPPQVYAPPQGYAPPLGFAAPQTYVFPPAAVYAPPPVVIYRHPQSRYYGAPNTVYPSAFIGGYPTFQPHDGYRNQYRRDHRRNDHERRDWRREYRDDRRYDDGPGVRDRGGRDGDGRGWRRDDD